MLTLKERLHEFIKHSNMSASRMEDEAGLGRSVLTKILEGKTKSISTSTLNKLKIKFPQLNTGWLQTGHGVMFEGGNDVYEKQHTLIYYPLAASAGYMNPYQNHIEDMPKIILTSDYGDCDSVFEVEGDSMYPQFSSGDKVACRRQNRIEYIRYGEAYIIDYGEGFVLKRIFKSENENRVSLSSDNKNYQDFDIEKSHIFGLWLVKGRISKNTGIAKSQ